MNPFKLRSIAFPTSNNSWKRFSTKELHLLSNQTNYIEKLRNMTFSFHYYCLGSNPLRTKNNNHFIQKHEETNPWQCHKMHITANSTLKFLPTDYGWQGFLGRLVRDWTVADNIIIIWWLIDCGWPGGKNRAGWRKSRSWAWERMFARIHALGLHPSLVVLECWP